MLVLRDSGTADFTVVAFGNGRVTLLSYDAQELTKVFTKSEIKMKTIMIGDVGCVIKGVRGNANYNHRHGSLHTSGDLSAS